MFFIRSDENETVSPNPLVTLIKRYIFECDFHTYHDNISDWKPAQCNQSSTHDNH